MDNKQQELSISWMAMNHALLLCLQSKTNHKLSRYDAFVWLVNRIHNGMVVCDKFGLASRQRLYCASYNLLAECWHWNRATVQQFIDELDDLGVISKKREGNSFVFSLNSKSGGKIIM